MRGPQGMGGTPREGARPIERSKWGTFNNGINRSHIYQQACAETQTDGEGSLPTSGVPGNHGPEGPR